MKTETPVYINYGIGRFMPMLQQFGQFLKTVPLHSFEVTRDVAPVGIIVSPRNNSGIPFCNLALALLYAAKGYPVTIIWDDLEFLDPEWDAQNRSVGVLVNAIKEHSIIDVIQLSTLESDIISDSDKAYLHQIAFQNAVWNVRNLVPTEDLETYTRLSFVAMCKNAGQIKKLYSIYKFDHCVHQSLVNNNGGIHKYFANQNRQRVGCFDVADERGLIGLSDVHGYFYDLLPLIDSASPFYLFENESYKQSALKLAIEMYNSRLYGKDEYATQPLSDRAASVNPYDIVIPLNIFWDAAALGRCALFDSPYDWLLSVVSYILFNTKYSVAVRQHPHEKTFEHQFETGKLLGDALVSRFEGHPRFKFIFSTDPVNTYHLIEQAKMVLPFTSTIGIEAALMGKPVIIASNVYYANQPFVSKANTVEDYFAQISRCEPVERSEEVQTKGWLLYFLATQTPFLNVPFGLNPADVQKWTAAGFDALNNNEIMNLAIHSMASNTPFSFCNGKHILEELLTKTELSNEMDFAHHS